MIVLGIDPGLGNTGYGIISVTNNDFSLVDFGVIKTIPHILGVTLGFTALIISLIVGLINIFKLYPLIQEVLKYLGTLFLLGHARGVSIAAASTNEVLVYEYSARKIKQSLTGNGNAHKDQVRFMVQNMLKLKEAPKSSDASDALAIALCYALQNKLEY